MSGQQQINNYITRQPEPKRSHMQALNHIILQVRPTKPEFLCLSAFAKIVSVVEAPGTNSAHKYGAHKF